MSEPYRNTSASNCKVKKNVLGVQYALLAFTQNDINFV